MSFTSVLEDSTLNRLFRNVSFPLSLTLTPSSLALWNGSPGEDGLGGDEVSFFTDGVSNGYARLITNTDDWTMAAETPTKTGGTVINQNVITFSSVLLDWGTVTHFALFGTDEIVMLIYGEFLGGPYNIIRGSIPRFDVGDLVVTLH